MRGEVDFIPGFSRPNMPQPQVYQMNDVSSRHNFNDLQYNLGPEDSFTGEELPYYHNLKRVQEEVFRAYPGFPLQSNNDLFENNYHEIIKKSAHQIEYLYIKLQSKSFHSPLKAVLDPSNPDAGQTNNTAYFQNDRLNEQNYIRLLQEN